MRLLLVSTPVSPIGAGDGGGVETSLRQLAATLRARGHEIAVIAPAGSRLPDGIAVYEVAGNPPPSAATAGREVPAIVHPEGVLECIWEQARRLAHEQDVVIASTYDWLSYYLTTFLPVPVLHWIHLPSLVDAVDTEIYRQYSRTPDSFAFCSRAQAATFCFVDAARARVIPGAVDLDQFLFCARPEPYLVWAARISPEKGLEDAVEVASEVGLPLHVCGKIQDEPYWREIAGSEAVMYHGCLSQERLAQVMGRARALLVTPKWVEAFGLTVIEALACGTPVIAYDRGGPGEIIEHGTSGFVVPADDVRAMADAVGQMGTLARSDARRRAEDFSIVRMAENIEHWVAAALESFQRQRSRGAAR